MTGRLARLALSLESVHVYGEAVFAGPLDLPEHWDAERGGTAR
jgi:hypothetical protein